MYFPDFSYIANSTEIYYSIIKMPLWLCRSFEYFKLGVHQTKKPATQTKNWSKFIYARQMHLYQSIIFVFSSILQSKEKNDEDNMEVTNRKV